MKVIASIIAMCLALAACTPTTVDTAIQQNLPKACATAAVAHEAFVAVSASGTIKASTINKEAAAWSGIQIVCADPANTNAATALVRVATAYAIIAQALREAKMAG